MHRAGHGAVNLQEDEGHGQDREAYQHREPREPQAVGEEPQEREQEGAPREAVLHQQRPVQAGGVARLRSGRQVQRIGRHVGFPLGMGWVSGRFLGGIMASPEAFPEGSVRTTYRIPFVEGMRPSSRGSTATARRRARARPLNRLSAMWWLFSP